MLVGLLRKNMTEKFRRPVIRLALNRSEVAIAIGVSVSSLDVMVSEGALPPPRLWHSRKLWIVSEIEAALGDLPIDGEERWPVRRLSTNFTVARKMECGAGGYPIPNSDVLWKYYNSLGFDPVTMNENDFARLHEANPFRKKSASYFQLRKINEF